MFHGIVCLLSCKQRKYCIKLLLHAIYNRLFHDWAVFSLSSMWCCPCAPASCADTGECSMSLSPPWFQCQALNTPTKGPSILSRHPVIILIKCNYHHSEDNWVLLAALFQLPLVPAPSSPLLHASTHRHMDYNCLEQKDSSLKPGRLEWIGGEGGMKTHIVLCTIRQPSVGPQGGAISAAVKNLIEVLREVVFGWLVWVKRRVCLRMCLCAVLLYHPASFGLEVGEAGGEGGLKDRVTL